MIQRTLSALDVGNDYLEIRQSVGGKPIILAKKSGVVPSGIEPVLTAILGTRWNLAYWQIESATSTGSEGEGGMIGNLLVGIVIVLILLLVTVAVFFRFRKPSSMGEAVVHSDIVYAGAVQTIMDGVHPGMGQLIPDLPGIKKKTSTPPTVSTVSKEMTGEDITSFTKAEDIQDVVPSNKGQDPTNKKNDDTLQKASQDATPEVQTKTESLEVFQVIFRKYDIRGVVGESLTVAIVEKIGAAIGSEALELGQQKIVVGWDGRRSSPELAEALIKGLQSSGRDVIDIGMVPTPVLYFATHFLDAHSGVMVTGSHNGPEYNGLKIVLAHNTLSEDAIQKIYARVKNDDVSSGQGTLQSNDIISEYVRRISEDIPVALGGALKIVIDCGNGVAGVVAPQLFNALGHDVIELYCDVDGSFPNHHPDPGQPENMQSLIAKVKEVQADIGFAFDGDGDRLGVVDGTGNIIWPDRQLMVLARDVLSRNPGAEIIFDVKCSKHLKKTIEDNGGKPLMWKTGHSLIKNKMKEVSSPLAGEMSGHIFFKERWYGFDDAMYSGARLLEVLVNAKTKPAEYFSAIPNSVATPELKINLAESEHKAFMGQLESKMNIEGAEVITIDGFRVELDDSWGLIRPSNTTPCLVARFEADNPEALSKLQSRFKEILHSVKSDLQIPF